MLRKKLFFYYEGPLNLNISHTHKIKDTLKLFDRVQIKVFCASFSQPNNCHVKFY